MRAIARMMGGLDEQKEREEEPAKAAASGAYRATCVRLSIAYPPLAAVGFSPDIRRPSAAPMGVCLLFVIRATDSKNDL